MVALAVSMSACETTNPYTGETEVSKATKGTAIGAAAGAVAGAIFGGGRKSVLISAGVGALAGGLVGNYMDEQDAKLRARLQGTGVSVTRVGDQIILNMPGNVTFASNSSNISVDFYPVLDSVALVLNEFNQTYVDVVGHTDSTGSDELNQRLSEQRALSVAQYLKSHQVLAERIATRGLGPKSPVASNATPEGRALNRRVEIVLTPIT
jgi:outer membrane protein OmpA-like peptidoglycan-associated protein